MVGAQGWASKGKAVGLERRGDGFRKGVAASGIGSEQEDRMWKPLDFVLGGHFWATNGAQSSITNWRSDLTVPSTTLT